ncbi:hypothetical protein GCM10012280_04960 [Wenjunlia tyrosinilytica]|uniref:Uncharacterized protein n=1 Tax=Wenjunlia tyrosinilytica TaxID=1544741 RepID=A0A917ZFY7_9ACTN|nr:hypothetical protein GCM10012280_04960 [Wenjunlia tyrosinilytica]
MFVRTCHPDRGGDPEVFAAELLLWRARLAGGSSPGAGPGGHRVSAYRRGPWPVRCGRAVAAAVRRRRRTRVT